MFKGTMTIRRRPFRATDGGCGDVFIMRSEWKEIETERYTFDCQGDLEFIDDKSSHRQAIINKSN
jgi:hypothetical protein